MRRLRDALTKSGRAGAAVKAFLVHEDSKVASGTMAVVQGVRALTWRDFLEQI